MSRHCRRTANFTLDTHLIPTGKLVQMGSCLSLPRSRAWQPRVCIGALARRACRSCQARLLVRHQARQGHCSDLLERPLVLHLARQDCSDWQGRPRGLPQEHLGCSDQRQVRQPMQCQALPGMPWSMQRGPAMFQRPRGKHLLRLVHPQWYGTRFRRPPLAAQPSVYRRPHAKRLSGAVVATSYLPLHATPSLRGASLSTPLQLQPTVCRRLPEKLSCAFLRLRSTCCPLAKAVLPCTSLPRRRGPSFLRLP
mmetsp:Transcript_26047/g.68430  ORF Transcript_26047/g.68430 Transcript_26047/m.68430 type:complete len:252 (+) Transcript_26047:3269-4024(+)